MNDPRMLTVVDADLLAEALPSNVRREALQTAKGVLCHLHKQQWTDRFEVLVGSEMVSIPHRLRFSSNLQSKGEPDIVCLAGKCFETRSNDGFQRQRALQPLSGDVQPWSAPFIVALIGEYVIEILRDIYDGLTPQGSAALADFIHANPRYWHLTRQRVASYWNVYYRAQFRRSNYIGFTLLDTLADAVRSRGSAVSSARRLES